MDTGGSNFIDISTMNPDMKAEPPLVREVMELLGTQDPLMYDELRKYKNAFVVHLRTRLIKLAAKKQR